jgi:hypothetical protein
MNCPNLEKCGFFNKFSGNSDVVKNGWIRMYCQDITKSDLCERKKLAKTGKIPPDNMTPTGKML